MIEAFVGLGSNLGDRLANLAAAVEALAREPAFSLRRVSSSARRALVMSRDAPSTYVRPSISVAVSRTSTTSRPFGNAGSEMSSS